MGGGGQERRQKRGEKKEVDNIKRLRRTAYLILPSVFIVYIKMMNPVTG